jgi:hypothetical protein
MLALPSGATTGAEILQRLRAVPGWRIGPVMGSAGEFVVAVTDGQTGRRGTVRCHRAADGGYVASGVWVGAGETVPRD